jgi:hypothetical protein
MRKGPTLALALTLSAGCNQEPNPNQYDARKTLLADAFDATSVGEQADGSYIYCEQTWPDDPRHYYVGKKAHEAAVEAEAIGYFDLGGKDYRLNIMDIPFQVAMEPKIFGVLTEMSDRLLVCAEITPKE